MRRAKQTFKIITNKYLIAVFVFLLLMLFFDENNLFVQLDRKRQLNELLLHKKYYEEKIEAAKKDLTNLESSPAAIEKFVRENFIMKRDNEDVFVVDEAPASDKDKK